MTASLDAWGFGQFAQEEATRQEDNSLLATKPGHKRSAPAAWGEDEEARRAAAELKPWTGSAPPAAEMGSSNQPSILHRIHARKHIVVEPRTAAALPSTLADYQRKLDDPHKSGCVLFAVARGKVAEVRVCVPSDR